MTDVKDYVKAYKNLADANTELQNEMLLALQTAVGYRYDVGPQKWATWEDCWSLVKALLKKYDYDLYMEAYAEDDEDEVDENDIDLGLLG